MTAAPGTSLIPGTDYTSGSSLDAADTWLGVDGNTGGFEIGSGGNRLELALTNQNTPFFILKNASGGTVYSVQKFGLATPSSTELVTSMFIYFDGTQEASDHFYINFGETMQASSGAVTTYTFQTLPFDLGTSGGSGASKSQAVLDQLVAGFSTGAGLGIELQNNAGDLNGNESVSISQVTDINALVYTAGGSSSASWFSGVAGLNATLSNFNNSAGVAAPFINGASVTFDDKTANGGHNGGVFTINLSTAAGVYPTYTNISGGTAYTFTGIGSINGIGALNLLGTSTLTLTNATNTYSGATNIGSGTLIAGALNVLSPNSPVFISGGTLDASGFNQSIASLNISSGTLKLGAGVVLTVAGSASFSGALNLVGTPASLPEILMTYQSATGTFASNNLPAGDILSYTPTALEVIVGGPSGPATLTWVNATGNGVWDIATSANFNTAGGTLATYSDTSNPTLSAGDSVIFNDNNGGAANYNVSIVATVHPTSVTVTTSNAYIFNGAANGSGGIAGPGTLTLSGSGSLTLNESNSYTGGTNVSGGTLFLGKATAFPAGTPLLIGTGAKVVAENLGTAYASTVSSLNISGGTIDLNNNDLVVQKSNNATVGGNLSAVTTLLTTGYNGGAWNGTSGILSSAAATNSSHLTTLGVIVNDSKGVAGGGSPLYGASGTIATTFGGATPALDDVLVKYTYYGDTNLDGKVDGSDYSAIDATFLSEGFVNGLPTTPVSGWQNGDFNYDGVVNGSDYTLIDNAFNTQSAALTSEIATATDQIAGSGATSAVPEPATLGLLGIGVLGLLGRRNPRRL